MPFPGVNPPILRSYFREVPLSLIIIPAGHGQVLMGAGVFRERKDDKARPGLALGT